MGKERNKKEALCPGRELALKKTVDLDTEVSSTRFEVGIGGFMPIPLIIVMC